MPGKHAAPIAPLVDVIYGTRKAEPWIGICFTPDANGNVHADGIDIQSNLKPGHLTNYLRTALAKEQEREFVRVVLGPPMGGSRSN